MHVDVLHDALGKDGRAWCCMHRLLACTAQLCTSHSARPITPACIAYARMHRSVVHVPLGEDDRSIVRHRLHALLLVGVRQAGDRAELAW